MKNGLRNRSLLVSSVNRWKHPYSSKRTLWKKKRKKKRTARLPMGNPVFVQNNGKCVSTHCSSAGNTLRVYSTNNCERLCLLDKLIKFLYFVFLLLFWFFLSHGITWRSNENRSYNLFILFFFQLGFLSCRVQSLLFKTRVCANQ